MFKTTAIDTLKQDKKCQACWYIILSTMSGSTTASHAWIRCMIIESDTMNILIGSIDQLIIRLILNSFILWS